MGWDILGRIASRVFSRAAPAAERIAENGADNVAEAVAARGARGAPVRRVSESEAAFQRRVSEFEASRAPAAAETTADRIAAIRASGLNRRQQDAAIREMFNTGSRATATGAQNTVMGQVRSWLGKGLIGMGGAGLIIGATNFVSEDSFTTRRTIDATIGGLLDKVGGTYNNIGYTGELIVGRMTNDPNYAIPLINRALGTNIQLGENGIIPPGQLEEALRVLATQGVRGQSFLEAPQIIEAYLKNQLNIPQDTPLADALAQGAQRSTSDANADALARYAATLRGEAPPPPAGASASAAAIPATTISISTLIDPTNGTVSNFMKNPTINLTVQFEGVSSILRNAAGSDNQLSADEAQRAMTQINGLRNLQDADRRAINDVIRSSFGMQPPQ